MSGAEYSRLGNTANGVRRGFVVSRAQEILLAILAISVISLMVLPLPPAMLDVLISINIGLSILLLMMSMYVGTPLGLSTFPTLLLFTTLLRLSLNIASTRAILLNADAGQIIDTFGQLVVGGSIIVGIVIFLIIAIVQFIVIAKGAERVAEVGARFTLDALPGKQMSIDAELRAGLIDKDESRAKRAQLQRESQLYGAMDGAMKFVKGDAIAGMLIALVNIIAGISIGVGVHEMALGDAASTYTILTVGDGLVSQIPSLFVSLSAGVLITRVSSDDESPSQGLSEDIGNQIGAQPKALLVTGLVLLLFTLVPGFPKLQFLFWGLLLGGFGWFLHRASVNRATPDPMAAATLHRDGIARPRTSADIDTELVNSYAVSLRLAKSLLPIVEDGLISTEIEQARYGVTQRLGIPFPGVSITISDQIPDNHYVILINEIPTRTGVVNHRMLEQAANESDPVTAQSAAATQIGQDLALVMRDNAPEFVGLQEIKHLLNETEKAFPDLVAEAGRGVPLARLTDVIKRLVDEHVPVRNMRNILEAMLEWAPREKDNVMLTECVRTALSRQLTYQHGGIKRSIRAITLSAVLEEKIRAAIQITAGGNYLALDPNEADKIGLSIDQTITEKSENVAAPAPVVLVSMDIRRYVRQLVESRRPELAVLAYQNLTSDATITNLAAIDG